MSLGTEIGRVIIDETRKSGRPMTQKESETLMYTLLIGRGTTAEEKEEIHLKLMESIGYNIIFNRSRLHIPGQKISVLALMFLASLCDRPGTAVLYVAVLAEIANCFNDPEREITVEDIVNYFPFDVPTEDILHQAWDKQKRVRENTDNALDHDWAWVNG